MSVTRGVPLAPKACIVLLNEVAIDMATTHCTMQVACKRVGRSRNWFYMACERLGICATDLLTDAGVTKYRRTNGRPKTVPNGIKKAIEATNLSDGQANRGITLPDVLSSLDFAALAPGSIIQSAINPKVTHTVWKYDPLNDRLLTESGKPLSYSAAWRLVSTPQQAKSKEGNNVA